MNRVPEYEVCCEWCEKKFTTKSAKTRTCSSSCRNRLNRKEREQELAPRKAQLGMAVEKTMNKLERLPIDIAPDQPEWNLLSWDERKKRLVRMAVPEGEWDDMLYYACSEYSSLHKQGLPPDHQRRKEMVDVVIKLVRLPVKKADGTVYVGNSRIK